MEEKSKLVKAIYAALHQAYPYPDDVRIFLGEWRPDSVSQDGQLGKSTPLTVWRSMAAFIPTTRRVSRLRKRSIATKEQSKMSVPDNEETLNGRPVIATGCSRGLGRSIFEALLARGADVTVVARDERELAEVAPWSTP